MSDNFQPARVAPIAPNSVVSAQAAAAPTMNKPDPAKADLFTAETLGHLVQIVRGVVASVPMLHNLAARADAMALAWEKAVFHSSPEAEVPPPATEGALSPAETQRQAELIAIRQRSPAQQNELDELNRKAGYQSVPIVQVLSGDPLSYAEIQRRNELANKPNLTEAEDAELQALIDRPD